MLEYMLNKYTRGFVITKDPSILNDLKLKEDFYRGLPEPMDSDLVTTIKRQFILESIKDFKDYPEEIIYLNPDLVRVEDYLSVVPYEVLENQMIEVVTSFTALEESYLDDAIAAFILRAGSLNTFIKLSDYQGNMPVNEELSAIINEICLDIIDNLEEPLEEVLKCANIRGNSLISVMALLCSLSIDMNLLKLHNECSHLVTSALMNILPRCQVEEEAIYIRRAAAILG